MASRRPIYRKQEKRSISKTGLLFCMLLAGGVMLVPIGGDFVYAAKTKLRDLALTSGLIEFKDCVVTPDHTLACSSHAAGIPLAAALRRMEDSETLAETEKQQRLRAESAMRDLALEVARLATQAAQSQLAEKANRFPPLAGEVTPTGMTGTTVPAKAPNTGSATVVDRAATPQVVDEPLIPPAEDDADEPATFPLTPQNE